MTFFKITNTQQFFALRIGHIVSRVHHDMLQMLQIFRKLWFCWSLFFGGFCCGFVHFFFIGVLTAFKLFDKIITETSFMFAYGFLFNLVIVRFVTFVTVIWIQKTVGGVSNCLKSQLQINFWPAVPFAMVCYSYPFYHT